MCCHFPVPRIVSCLPLSCFPLAFQTFICSRFSILIMYLKMLTASFRCELYVVAYIVVENIYVLEIDTYWKTDQKVGCFGLVTIWDRVVNNLENRLKTGLSCLGHNLRIGMFTTEKNWRAKSRKKENRTSKEINTPHGHARKSGFRITQS